MELVWPCWRLQECCHLFFQCLKSELWPPLHFPGNGNFVAPFFILAQIIVNILLLLEFLLGMRVVFVWWKTRCFISSAAEKTNMLFGFWQPWVDAVNCLKVKLDCCLSPVNISKCACMLKKSFKPTIIFTHCNHKSQHTDISFCLLSYFRKKKWVTWDKLKQADLLSHVLTLHLLNKHFSSPSIIM